MKRLSGLLALAGVVVLGVTPAFAGSSTDAALGLGAFAVFNQILSGTGVFGAGRPVYREVVVALREIAEGKVRKTASHV